MREIKFRAWDKEHKEMINLIGWEVQEGSTRITHSNHFNSDDGVWRGYMWNSRDLILMQFTGLKDRNGVEIYEGDVLLYEHPYAGTWKEVVAYEPDKGAFSPLYKYHKTLTVLGNIYSTPELLK